MALVGWVATHTGLPSFYATGDGRLTADVTEGSVVVGTRLVTTVKTAALVSDVGGPAGIPVVYRFGGASVTLMRRAGDVHQQITSADGETVADVRIVGDDQREYDTEARVFTSSLGTHIPRFRLGQPPPTGTLEVLTTGAGTRTLRGFVTAKEPLWVVHNVGACQIPDCDIEGARLIVAHRLSEARTRRRDTAQREWTIDYSRVPDSLATLQSAAAAPVVTWGQWAEWSKTHTPKGWQHWSALDVAQRVAGMPT